VTRLAADRVHQRLLFLHVGQDLVAHRRVHAVQDLGYRARPSVRLRLHFPDVALDDGAAALPRPRRGQQRVAAPLDGLSAEEIAAFDDAGPAKWHPKICERDPALAKALGLPYVGGDVFLDGSIGSGTAAVSEPYADRPGCGTLMHGDAEVERYFAAAEELGISAGVHAIGDRAIDAHVKNVRRKLEPDPRNPRYVLTVHGVGYKFAE